MSSANVVGVANLFFVYRFSLARCIVRDMVGLAIVLHYLC